MLDETQARLMFGNIKNFSYLNSWFAPVRQPLLALVFRRSWILFSSLTELFSVQITNRRKLFGLLICIAEKNCLVVDAGGI